jgi:hypothetical protein
MQPAAPSRKNSRGAPRIVQADGFFNCDSHAFNNRRVAEDHAERGLRSLFPNATGKACADSPHLPRCAVVYLCLVSGSVVEESTMQLSPFTDNLS